MSNNTDNFTFTPLIAISIPIFILSTSISIVAYIFVLAIMIIYFKEFKSNFYLAVISLGLADMMFLLLVLFFCVPSIVQQEQFWTGPANVSGIIEALSYFSQCTHLTYIAINHLISASSSKTKHPILVKLFHTRLAVIIWIILLWLLSTPCIIIWQVAGCLEIFDYVTMAFHLRCHDSISALFTWYSRLLTNIVSGLLPCLVAFLHIMAWLVIRFRGKPVTLTLSRSRSSTNEFMQQKKREKRILIQFTLISAILMLSYATFWAIPAWFGPDSSAMVIITLVCIVAAGMNPFIYLYFNKLIKSKAKYLINTILKKVSVRVHAADDGGSGARPLASVAANAAVGTGNVGNHDKSDDQDQPKDCKF